MTDERRPPFDADAEVDCLGAMLTRNPAADDVFTVLTPDDFYVPKHRWIAQVMFDLWRDGKTIDVPAVVERMNGRAERSDVLALYASSIPYFDTRSVARIIAEKAIAREAIRIAGDLAAAAWNSDLETIHDLVDRAAEALDVSTAPAEEGLTFAAASTIPPEGSHSWVVPDLIDRGEVVIVTGAEGGGKSTLFRQFGVLAAAGRHPLYGGGCPPVKVLNVDLQDFRLQNAREYHLFRDRLERGGLDPDPRFRLIERPGGIDLTTRAGVSWLRAQCDAFEPDLLILGPLYNAFRGGPGRNKDSEETVELVIGALTRIMVAHGCALLLEGHSPHGEHGDRAGGRVRGSALWEGWATGVMSLRRIPALDGERPAVDVVRVRGFRDRSRRWPHRLYEGLSGEEWPWVAAADEDVF